MRPVHIAIVHVESIPVELFAGFTEAVSTEKLDLQVQSREDGGAFAALEWLIPTAVIVYISKSYFDGFLKEMGKDHYNLLKSGLKQLKDKVVGPVAPKVTVVGSSGKISGQQPYSLFFSVLAEAESGITFKLLVQTDSSPEQFERSIEAFLEFLSAFHEHTLDNSSVEKLATSRVVGRTLLLTFSTATNQIEIVDPVPKRMPLNEA